jgi:serine/threonine protein kinase
MDSIILENSSLIINEYKKNGKEFTFKNIVFKFIGEGGFGIVFKATNDNLNYTVKIFKKSNPKEVNKCILLNEKIHNINPKFNKLVDKYITKIISISPKMDIVILDYAEGEDIKNYMEGNEINNEKFSILVCKMIITIRLFHKILKLSHRDIKPKNLIFDKKTMNLRLIDYGFVCEINDKECYSHYQGTSLYIHPGLNKNAINSYNNNYNNYYSENLDSTSIISNSKSNKSKFRFKFKSKSKSKSKKSRVNSSKSKFSLKKSGHLLNTETKKNIINSKSQDIFSLIITILFIFSHVINTSTYNNSIKNVVNDYKKSFKDLSGIDKYINRLENKNILLKTFKTLKSKKIKNQVIKCLINNFNKYWNFNKYTFTNKSNKDNSTAVIKSIFNISVKNIKDVNIQSELLNDMNLINQYKSI